MQPDRLRRLPHGSRVRHDGEERESGSNAQHARHEERGAPAEYVHQRTGDQGGGGEAEIAPQSVPAERGAELRRRSDEHGDADRMVDGGENTDQRKPEPNLPRRAGETGEDERGADAE